MEIFYSFQPGTPSTVLGEVKKPGAYQLDQTTTGSKGER
jgi:protein involved in polysaccharide export with SLBB domain